MRTPLELIAARLHDGGLTEVVSGVTRNFRRGLAHIRGNCQRS
jgi:hypothetical protein